MKQVTGLVARTGPGLTATATPAQTSGRTFGLREIGPTLTVSEPTMPAAISVVVTGLTRMRVRLIQPPLMAVMEQTERRLAEMEQMEPPRRNIKMAMLQVMTMAFGTAGQMAGIAPVTHIGDHE